MFKLQFPVRARLIFLLAALLLLIITATKLSAAPIIEANQASSSNSPDAASFTSLMLPDIKLDSNGTSGNNFGQAVAMTSEFAVVAAHRLDAGLFNEKGAVYIFGRDQGGTENWGIVKTLSASDGVGDDFFGYSVDISGDTIVVGANGVDLAGGLSEAGAAYVFERHAGGTNNWGEVAKLTASDAAAIHYFGESVSIDGDTIVVGATGVSVNFSSQGAAYIYDRNNGGDDNWGFSKKLFATDGLAVDDYGQSVSISADTVVIGAAKADIAGNVDQGTAYVYDRDRAGTGNWGLSQKLLASDGTLNNYFGHSVSISHDTIVVGGYGNSGTTGAAYVYDRSIGGDDTWDQVTKLVANDGATGDRFGESVVVSGSTILVGAPTATIGLSAQQGASYIFQRYKGGPDNWDEVTKSVASDGTTTDRFGHSVAIAGPYTLVGAPQADITGNVDEGAAYVMRWQQACTPLAGSATDLALALGNAACNPIAVQPGTYEGCFTLDHDAAIIAGNGSAETIIDGGDICTAITVSPGVEAQISAVTVTGGNGNEGGGIKNDNGVLVLEDVVLSGNEALFGGGLHNGNGGVVTFISSTIADNMATSQGGGVYNSADSKLDIWNSTLSGNDSAEGGALYNLGSAKFVNVTAANNKTDGLVNDAGQIELANTILADNTSDNCVAKNAGTFTSSGHNLMDDATCGAAATGDQIVANAGLHPLRNNGGDEPTHMLTHTSPALDSGDDVICAAALISNVDQRGVARPYNWRCDIGAVESDQRACTTPASNGFALAANFADSACNPIIVPEGEYEGCFDLGHNAVISGTGSAETILMGDGTCSTVTIQPGVIAEIQDATVTGGNGIEGGGVDNNGGIIRLEDVAVISNTAQIGGGIDNGDGGTTVLVNSTVANNVATTQGGGINNATNGTFELWNTTLSSNTAPIGGGIYNGGALQSTNATIAFNTNDGIYNAGGSTTLVNTLLGNNGAMNCLNASGSIVSAGHNLADDATCMLIASGDVVTDDVQLHPLEDNGGGERTHLPMLGSAALDAADATVCTQPEIRDVDQRDVARPQGASCDIGAVEVMSHELMGGFGLYLPIIVK